MIEEDIDIGTAGSRTVDIELVDVVSALMMKFNVTSVADAPTPLKHPVETVSKVELVDGSDVLESLTGKQLMAAYYWGTKRNPVSMLGMGNGVHAYFTIPLMFGRDLWDRDLAFDPSKFTNPQLKLTYDKATCDAGSTAMTYSLMASVFDERKVSPRGFLTKKQIETYTPVAATHEYVTMPLDYSYRMILLEGYASDNHVRRQIKTVKLSEDIDKKVPINMETYKYLWNLAQYYPEVAERFNIKFPTTAVTHHTMATYEKVALGYPPSDQNVYIADAAGDQLTVELATSAQSVEGKVAGEIPFHIFPLLFGNKDDMGDFYKLSPDSTLKLDLLAHSSVGTGASGTVMVEQFRPY